MANWKTSFKRQAKVEISKGPKDTIIIQIDDKASALKGSTLQPRGSIQQKENRKIDSLTKINIYDMKEWDL